MKDIFSDMQARIGCTYISDLPHHKGMVWQEMKRLNLADYPQKQLSKLYDEYGNVCMVVDADLKNRVQTALLDMLMNFEIVVM